MTFLLVKSGTYNVDFNKPAPSDKEILSAFRQLQEYERYINKGGF